MGEPANCPSFKELVKNISASTNREIKDGEAEDCFLGDLQRAGVEIHSLAAKELTCGKPQPTSLHCNLLRLFVESQQVRIVTTNFDLLFVQAAREIFNSKPEIYKAPALPLGSRFKGILHIHGTCDQPNNMVLTDIDFGKAYLHDGWASKFLIELFKNYTTLFIGFSHSETILNYLSKSLMSQSLVKRRFALVKEKDSDRWESLGIEPIPYTNNDALSNSIRQLADYTNRSILDWKSEIPNILEKPPSLMDEKTGIIEEAIKDKLKVQFFENAKSSPEWINWLNKRNAFNNLFREGQLSDIDKSLAQWLARQFAVKHPNELFNLVAQHKLRINPGFWSEIVRSIQTDEINPESLDRWVCILLATFDSWKNIFMFQILLECCNKHNLVDRMVQIFEAITKYHLHNLTMQHSTGSEIGYLNYHSNAFSVLQKLWKKGLQPNLNLISERLLSQLVVFFESLHHELCLWTEINNTFDQVSFLRQAIEPHKQNNIPKFEDVLIDAARDCLELQVSNPLPSVGAYWCDYLSGATAPILRRLAVHGLSRRRDLNDNEKIDWLLERIGLNEILQKHEIFMAMKVIYPSADFIHRKKVIQSILDWQGSESEDNNELNLAYYRFNWMHWLNSANPKCVLTKQYLDEILSEYPDFEPKEYPDLNYFFSSSSDEFVGQRSPWSIEQILEKEPIEIVVKHISFKGNEENSRISFEAEILEAVIQKPEWGMKLAFTLEGEEEWETDLWVLLLQAWSNPIGIEHQLEKVFQWLEISRLQKTHHKVIAEFLSQLFIKVPDSAIMYEHLENIDEIAGDLWTQLIQEEEDFGIDDWLFRAVNHPAGKLCQVWIFSLSSWWQNQDPRPVQFNSSFQNTFECILEDTSLNGRLSRAILVQYCNFLFAVDENWTRNNVIPLLTKFDDISELQVAWDGLYYSEYLRPQIAEALCSVFLSAVEKMKCFGSNSHREKFVEMYTNMLCFYSTKTNNLWVPKFFRDSSEADRKLFAINIYKNLLKVDTELRQKWWERWLREYWEIRLSTKPVSLSIVEIHEMLHWLPLLKAVFPEAVDLATQMRVKDQSSQRLDGSIHFGSFARDLEDKGILDSHPIDTCKLIIYVLDSFNIPDYEEYEFEKVSKKLLNSAIPDDLKGKLEESLAKHNW